ncbi:MAG: translation initiation factor IF-2 [Eubacterium sp.]|jgi:translation initiation factor IF-2|uniref:translation initiation factor IF-2 n=1 Tax=Eubacterium sp. F2 TaxID=3381348 RepID=UPI0039082520|nr:translation initiation factor IF-2 [Eubacterium sp.]MCI2197589.1 translation initiation factor IF-2 [Eubacterium sp.]
MTKKVFELARELGVSSKELLSKAGELGIKVKTHASLLSDAEVGRLTEKFSGSDAKSKQKSAFVGRPIVDEEYLASKHKPPMGKPVVDESVFDRKKKKEKTPEEKKAPAETKAEPAEKKTEKKPSAEPEKKAAEKAAEKKPAAEGKEKKNEHAEHSHSGKKQEKGSAEKTKEAKQSGEKVARKTEKPVKKEKKEHKIKIADSEKISMPGIKIVKTAEQVKKEEKTLKEKRASERKKREEERHKKNEKRRNERKNERGEGFVARGGSNRSFRTENSAGSSSEGGRSGNRAHRRHGKDSSSHNKFDKFERKSLEKKQRKKYQKTQKEPEVEEEEEVLPEGTFKLDVPITVAGFAEQTEVSTSKVIMTLMKMGVMANINQTLDEDTVQLLADELGINVVIGEVEKEEVEEGIEDFKDDEKDLRPRPPVITVMGHVDHGKTSLLDAIRKTNVTSRESGGITQHIGASEVKINGKKIVFLDTPGHEAFTAMRARGAQITDIAVLVVAADDGVMPQTVESISHAKAADVPIIVAINKMDKPGANPDRVKKELADHGVLVEDWGGDVISVPVSAKTGKGIKELLEMILLQADMMELKANPNRLALGSVIEARLDRARGPVATLLVENGTLKSGQSIVAGTCSGRIRLMTDYRGKKIRKAGPATAVEVLGLTDVPQAGDVFNAVRDDKTAREIAEHRQEKLREETLAKNSSMSLEKLFSQIKEGETKELNLIIKADVQGSVGALVSSLEKLNNDSVKINVIHSGVGTVNESDVMLAETSNAIIIGFNVRPSSAVTAMADQKGVEVRLYTVIYDAINDVDAAMKGLLEPDTKEEALGKAEIRSTFKVPKVGIIGGAYVTEGKVARNAQIRLVRDGIVVHEGTISSLKRYKDDAKEVNQGYECGIGIEDYNDIKEGDIIECYHIVEVKHDEQ